MTSPLTTGGIRGGSADGMEKFKPRSFNLGCRRSVYLQLGGFNEAMRFGEDIDFSLRLIEGGIARHSSKKPSCTTSAEWTSASSSSRSITRGSHVSTWRRAIGSTRWYTFYPPSSPLPPSSRSSFGSVGWGYWLLRASTLSMRIIEQGTIGGSCPPLALPMLHPALGLWLRISFVLGGEVYPSQ